MNVRKTDDFIADVERQYQWYVVNAGLEIGDHYLDTVKSTCQLLGQHPLIGPQVGFAHPRLREWRFFLVFRPFKKHVLFYEIRSEEIVMRRAMHGRRDLHRRLLEPSRAS
jgi:plasmid stabilization system protein ParE